MPANIIQGQSCGATEAKQIGLSYIWKQNLAAYKKAVKGKRFPYFHFDLNCGSGINDIVGCAGSPLTFLSAVSGLDNWDAWFCDIEEDQTTALEQRIGHNPRCRVITSDNAELVKQIPDLIAQCGDDPRYAFGTILADPNGAAMPLEELADTLNICQRVDVVMHWNSTVIKRLRGGIKPEQRSLREAIGMLPKKHWQIRAPMSMHQFTMLIGRNYKTNSAWESNGYHWLDAPKGQDILNKCNLNKADYQALSGQKELRL